jgi:tyrosine-protein phosphatase YwqE
VNSRFHRGSMYPFYSMPSYHRHADQGMMRILKEGYHCIISHPAKSGALRMLV